MDIFQPLQTIADAVTYSVFQIEQETVLAESVNFFVYDILKIFLLLIVVTHLMSLVRHYLPTKKIQKFLGSRKFYGLDYLIATLFGAITPFCSCSSIPLFIGFLQARLPLGIIFAFLITSPLVNEVALALFLGLFGWKITLLYLLAGIGIGVLGGFVMGKLNMEKYIISLTEKKGRCCCKNEPTTFGGIAKSISREAFSITRKVSLYIIIGVGIGAAIHGYIPADFFEVYLQKAGVLAVPLSVILAVPLYANASGVIPIIEALVAKGVPLGTALAFMMATVGLSLPEAMMLKRVLKLPLLLSYFGIVTVGIIMIGFLFNISFPANSAINSYQFAGIGYELDYPNSWSYEENEEQTSFTNEAGEEMMSIECEFLGGFEAAPTFSEKRNFEKEAKNVEARFNVYNNTGVITLGLTDWSDELGADYYCVMFVGMDSVDDGTATSIYNSVR